MRPNSTTDTRSPWYEAFTPQARPKGRAAMWILSPAERPRPEAPGEAPSAAPESDWATEALFDYYND